MTGPRKERVSKKSSSLSRWDALAEYDENQRLRVEELKQQLREDEWPYDTRSRFEREKIDTPPSTFQKFGRSILDLANLKIPTVEKRRDREAMSTAIKEFKVDEDEKEVNRQMKMAEEDTIIGVRQIMWEEVEKRENEKLLAIRAAAANAQAAQKEHDRSVSEHVQKFVEGQLNEKLLKIRTLEDEILAKNPEVKKQTIDYEDPESKNISKITVYDLKGFPFSLLTTAIDYRHANADNPNHIGVQTMEKLLKNPSMWAETEEEAKKSEGYGTRNGNARGNVISASYTNSDSNIGSKLENIKGYAHTVYGFSKLRDDSIIDIFLQDGGTTNTCGHIPTQLDEHHLKIFDILEGPDDRTTYNEVLMRRYDKAGMPFLPDYIVTEDGAITDAIKKHAAYFGIPIINIDREIYVKKDEKAAMDALEAIDENMNYKEISEKIDTARKVDYFNFELRPLKIIGDGREAIIINLKHQNAENEKDKKIADVMELEIKKRLEFIENEIKRCIKEVKKANEKGEKYEYSSDTLESFDTDVYDIESDLSQSSFSLHSWFYSNKGRKMGNQRLGGMSYSTIIMRFKGSTRNIETRLFDWEHRYNAEEYYKFYPDERRLQYDNSAYKKITPLLLEYYDSLQENKQFNKLVL